MEVRELPALAQDVRDALAQKTVFPGPVVFVKQFVPGVGWRARLLAADQHRLTVSKVVVVLLYGSVVDARAEECVTVSLANAVCTQIFPLQMAIKTPCGNVLLETESPGEMDALKALLVGAARALTVTSVVLDEHRDPDAVPVVFPPQQGGCGP